MSELLLMKMNIKSSGFNIIARGGKTLLTEYDVAAALGFGRLSKPAYYLARAKYCDDTEAAQALKRVITRQVQQQSISKQWDLEEDRVEGVVDLIMCEGVYGVSCKKCKGMGNILSGRGRMQHISDCKKCEGSGRGKLSQRQRAVMAKLSLSSWHRYWNERLNLLISDVNTWESELIQHVKRQCYSALN